MAMTTCRECDHDVSTEARPCPHSGAAKPTRRHKRTVALFFSMLIALVLATACTLTRTVTRPDCRMLDKSTGEIVPCPSEQVADPMLNSRQLTIMNAFEQCRGAGPGVQLSRVNPDGSFYMEGTDTSVEKVMQCLERRGAAHRR